MGPPEGGDTIKQVRGTLHECVQKTADICTLRTQEEQGTIQFYCRIRYPLLTSLYLGYDNDCYIFGPFPLVVPFKQFKTLLLSSSFTWEEPFYCCSCSIADVNHPSMKGFSLLRYSKSHETYIRSGFMSNGPFLQESLSYPLLRGKLAWSILPGKPHGQRERSDHAPMPTFCASQFMLHSPPR